MDHINTIIKLILVDVVYLTSIPDRGVGPGLAPWANSFWIDDNIVGIVDPCFDLGKFAGQYPLNNQL